MKLSILEGNKRFQTLNHRVDLEIERRYGNKKISLINVQVWL